ncbi:MAG: lamin tail domain-containing protein [Gemmatimonadetes bacterium]|nr:lamin tail domain-containing protein [Gemmatimonadota bacterium]
MKPARNLSSCTSLLLAFLLGAIAFDTSVAAGEPGDVVFSELMWMGSESSSADEWIELYNRGSSAKDLSGWTITQTGKDGEEAVMLRLSEGRIAPGAAFLISNYNAARSQISVDPDVVATSVALPNSKLLLRLYSGDPEAGGNLIDTADDGSGAPLAGDNKQKAAMVRVEFDTDGSQEQAWATATEASGWDDGSSELGTPGSIPERLMRLSTGETGEPADTGPKKTDMEDTGSGESEEPIPTAVQGSSWGVVKQRVLPLAATELD